MIALYISNLALCSNLGSIYLNQPSEKEEKKYIKNCYESFKITPTNIGFQLSSPNIMKIIILKAKCMCLKAVDTIGNYSKQLLA